MLYGLIFGVKNEGPYEIFKQKNNNSVQFKAGLHKIRSVGPMRPTGVHSLGSDEFWK